jgi:DNA polymerase III epsilon subunit-like protein
VNRTAWPGRLLVVDVEGNGRQPPDLVEFAALPIHSGELSPAAAWATLLRPLHPITPMATRIHGITNQDVENAPSWPQAADRIRTLLDGAWIAAHNARTEYDVLTRHLPAWQPAGVIDTLRLSRHLYGKTTRHGLDALIQHTRIDTTGIPGRRHRAAFDAHATGLLLVHMANRFDTWEQLTAVAVPDNMPGTSTPEGTLW